MAKIDIARALKDRKYFDTLSKEDQQMVRNQDPNGASGLNDRDLESVSGGLEGGERALGTTTTTSGTCSCSSSAPYAESDSCACSCG